MFICSREGNFCYYNFGTRFIADILITANNGIAPELERPLAPGDKDAPAQAGRKESAARKASVALGEPTEEETDCDIRTENADDHESSDPPRKKRGRRGRGASAARRTGRSD